MVFASGIKLRLRKCKFAQKLIKFLGTHLQKWSRERLISHGIEGANNKKQVKQFVGMLSFNGITLFIVKIDALSHSMVELAQTGLGSGRKKAT